MDEATKGTYIDEQKEFYKLQIIDNIKSIDRLDLLIYFDNFINKILIATNNKSE